MQPQTFEVKDGRWYRLTLRGGVLSLLMLRRGPHLEDGGEGKAPNPYVADDITIYVGIKEIVVQYPARVDASVSQKFCWNYVALEQGELYGFAWIVIDLGLQVVTLRLKKR